MALIKKNPITGIPARPTTTSREEPPDEYDTAVVSPDDLADETISRSREFSTPDPGRYEAIVNNLEVLPMKDTGLFIRAEFILADPDPKLMGKRHSVLFQIKKEDGRTDAEWGPVFYQRMMAKLGYPKDNRGKEAREEITKEKPGVYLKISAGKQEGFVNTTVEGRFDKDNDNIEALREWLDNNPY